MPGRRFRFQPPIFYREILFAKAVFGKLRYMAVKWSGFLQLEMLYPHTQLHRMRNQEKSAWVCVRWHPEFFDL